MNCCHHHQKEHNETSEHVKTSRHKGHQHGIIMILLCLIPMGLVFLFPLLKLENFQSSPYTYLILLLCPIMHIVMVFGMRKDHHND